MFNVSTGYDYPVGRSFVGSGALSDVELNRWEPCVRDIVENYPSPMSESWIKYFMDIATVVASKSKDRTKVGCVLVSPTNKQILSTGFNGFCRDIADTPERYADREVKMDYVVHAEANAICFAASSGMRTDGCYAFITLPPCHSCAKLLKQAGVTNIFYMEDLSAAPTQEIKDDWRKKQQLSLDILREANINTYRCCEVNINRPDRVQLIAIRDINRLDNYQHPLHDVPQDLKKELVDELDQLLYDLCHSTINTALLKKINQLGYDQKIGVVRYINTSLEKRLFDTSRSWSNTRPIMVLNKEGLNEEEVTVLTDGSMYEVHRVIPV